MSDTILHVVSTFFKQNPTIEKLNFMNCGEVLKTYYNPDRPPLNEGTFRVVASAYIVDNKSLNYFEENPTIFGTIL